MKKTLLALVIPAAVIGAGVAGAWYTGTRVEPEINRALEHANAELQKAAPGAGISVSLLGLERGLFSSQARYQITFPDEEGGEPHTLVFADHLEHGPFPPSRLIRGRLLPVLAHSSFTLEPTAFTRPLFAAAVGQAPLAGEVAIGYDGSQQGEATLAALTFNQPAASLRLSPARFAFGISGDYNTTQMEGELAELDLVGVEPESGAPIRIEARGLSMEADKARNSAGFALGPGKLTAASLLLQAQEGPVVTLRDAVVEEALAQNGEHLEQTIAYRIAGIQVAEQAIGSLTLALSARHLDQAALKQLADTYNQILLASVRREGEFGGELSPEQEQALQEQALHLLAGAPKLALDELSLKTANGEARLALAVDLRKPDDQAESFSELADGVLAALNASAKVDKGVVGDLAVLQARLDGAPDDAQMLAQQSAAASELFSGVALNSGWATLEGDSLKSSLSYANQRVTFNGREMSVEQFIDFALGSMQGMGMH